MTEPSFDTLTPSHFLDAVEKATGSRLTGMANPMTSYINRVYELQTEDDQHLIAKFYRPGRWSRAAIQDEHDFVLACAEDEIPVIAPLTLQDGQTIGEADGIAFAVFPRRYGRGIEFNSDEDWTRLGHVLGRIHVVGARETAENRILLTPDTSTAHYMDHLLNEGHVSSRYEDEFDDLCDEILATINPLFENCEQIRVHGDCHAANILDRPDEGLMVIDFDDTAMGPPVQDLWMLLPDHAHQARKELDLILQGYEQFRSFNRNALRMIEGLRLMRILYFLAWCSTQKEDYRFQTTFPNWGSDGFWQAEIKDLRYQLDMVRPD